MKRTAAAVLVAAVVAGCYRPASPTGPLRRTTDPGRTTEFVVIGDFGTGDAPQYAVAAAIRAWAEDRPVDLLVTTGDNIYERGHPERFDGLWRRPYGWLRPAGIDVVGSLGNHDVRTDAGRPVMRLLGMPGPWYAHRAGPVELFVLDGNRPQDADQLEFLREALERSDATWQVVVIHHPPYSCSAEHGSAADVQALIPAMAEGGVDVVLSGHDHLYQRFGPIRGITFVVSGGAGGPWMRRPRVPRAPLPRPRASTRLTTSSTSGPPSGPLAIRAISVPGSDVVDGVKLSA